MKSSQNHIESKSSNATSELLRPYNMQSQTFIAPNDIQPSHAYSGSYDYSELTTRRPGISVSLKLCAVCHCLSTSTQKLHESIPDKSSTKW